MNAAAIQKSRNCVFPELQIVASIRPQAAKTSSQEMTSERLAVVLLTVTASLGFGTADKYFYSITLDDMAGEKIKSSNSKIPIMRLLTRWLLLIPLLASPPTPAAAATLFKDPQFRVKVTRNVQYAVGDVRQPNAAKRQLFLDVFQPDTTDSSWKRPAMIAIHGGGFLFGDKSEMTSICRELAARGYVCFSMNYRLVPDDPPGASKYQYERTVMAAVADADHAARWVEANAAKYHVDLGRLFIGGSSAGAVTSMLLAYNPDTRPPHFRAVADMWGTMGPRVNWIRKGGPPLLIIHGKEDETITVSAAEQIDARAKQVGLPHQTYLIDDAGHSVPLNLEVGGETLLQHLVDFFYNQIGQAGR
jgi:acetyl esterase/lipase